MLFISNSAVNKFLKKWVIYGVAVFSLVLAGCSTPNDVKDEYDDITVQELEPVQLNFYAMDYGRGSNDEFENISKEIEKKLADTIKLKPEFHLIGYEKYEEEVKSLVNSGKSIDAFACYGPYQFQNFDFMMDIKEMLPKYAPDYYKELMSNQIGEDNISSSSVGGKLYSVPINNFDCPRYFIVARKDLVDKYGENGFETFEDYEGFLKGVKENEEKLIPGVVFPATFFDAYIKGKGYYNFDSYLYSPWNGNGKDLNSIENIGEFTAAYSMLKSWRDKDYTPKNPQAYYEPYYISHGLLASQLISIDEVRNLNIDKVSNAYEYKLYPLYMEKTHLLRVNPRGVAVASCSKNADRVLMFIEWLHKSQENYDLLRYGVKDRNYSLDGENLVFPEDIKPIPSWNTVTDFFSDYRYERTCFLDTINYRKILKEASLKNIKTQREVFKEFEDRQGDKGNSEKLAAEWEDISPIINKYNENIMEFYRYLEMGSGIITPEKLKEMQKDAGIDKVVEYYRNKLSGKE